VDAPNEGSGGLDRAGREAESTAAPFLADLCHRVRTPLNGILGTLELLLEGDLSDESRELARVAYDSAQVLHRVFEDDLEAAVHDTAV
jgi:signal transduction histidine kinase